MAQRLITSTFLFRNFISLVFVLLVMPCVATAEVRSDASADGAFQRSRLLYYSLKRSDPNVTDLVKWENVGAELIQYLEKYPKSRNEAQALFLLAQLNDNMFRQREFQSGAGRAKYFYQRLTEQYPKHFLSDDALVYLGDLYRDVDHDYETAEKVYSRVKVEYRLGDMNVVAENRIIQLAPLKDLGEEPKKVIDEEGEQQKTLIGRIFRPSGEEVFAEKEVKPRTVVIIDPGHGGEDLGAVGVDGILEKDIALDISKELAELIKDGLRADAVLTRDKDQVLSLEERTNFANTKNADLLISVHANASELRNARGIETYYLDNTDDQASLKLAERENKVANKATDDVSFIISDFIQNVKLDDSISLAHHLQDSLHHVVSRYYKEVKNLGVKKAPFYVLVGAHMPCALVEVSFIDHPLDGKRLKEKRYRKLIAQGLYQGVRDYFQSRQAK